MDGPESGRQVHGHKADITRSNSTALGGAATTATGVARRHKAGQGEHGAGKRTRNATREQDVARGGRRDTARRRRHRRRRWATR